MNIHIYATEPDGNRKCPAEIDAEIDRSWLRVFKDLLTGAERCGLSDVDALASFLGANEGAMGEFVRVARAVYEAGWQLAVQLRPEMYSTEDRISILERTKEVGQSATGNVSEKAYYWEVDKATLHIIIPPSLDQQAAVEWMVETYARALEEGGGAPTTLKIHDTMGVLAKP